MTNSPTNAPLDGKLHAAQGMLLALAMALAGCTTSSGQEAAPPASTTVVESTAAVVVPTLQVIEASCEIGGRSAYQPPSPFVVLDGVFRCPFSILERLDLDQAGAGRAIVSWSTLESTVQRVDVYVAAGSCAEGCEPDPTMSASSPIVIEIPADFLAEHAASGIDIRVYPQGIANDQRFVVQLLAAFNGTLQSM